MAKRRPAADADLVVERYTRDWFDLLLGVPGERAAELWRANRERLRPYCSSPEAFERRDRQWSGPEWMLGGVCADYTQGVFWRHGRLVFGPPVELWQDGELVPPADDVTVRTANDLALEAARSGGYRAALIAGQQTEAS